MKIRNGDWITVRLKVKDTRAMQTDRVWVEVEQPDKSVAVLRTVLRSSIVGVEPRPPQVGDVVTWGTKDVNYRVVAIEGGHIFLLSQNGQGSTNFPPRCWPQFEVVS